MPTLQSKRNVILKTSVSASTVSQLSLTMDALLSTATGSGSIRWQDASDSAVEEKSKYLWTFLIPGGAEIGQMSLRLVGDAQLPSGSSATVSVERATSTFNPRATTGTVSLIDQPEASFERIWKRATKNSSNVEVVDGVVKLDVRVVAEDGYGVTQTVTTTSDDQLVLTYAWAPVGGSAVLTGTVTLDTAVTAGAGYSLGAVEIVDNNPTTGEELLTRVRGRRAPR